MSTAIFFLLAFVTVAVIIFPLLPGRSSSQALPASRGREAAAQAPRPRPARSKPGMVCPTCGEPYEPGDRFCVGCGGILPRAKDALPTCSACGTPLADGDRFCRKCGQPVTAGEAGR
jgi:predicted nucleic acid-binding Zn ribbon protein